MPFPTTGVLDNFNRSNEGPPPSSSWVNALGSGLQVVSNQCEPNATDNSTSSTWNTSYAADQEAFVKVIQVPNGANSYIAVYLRLATANDYNSDHYEINFYSGRCEVWKRKSGSWTQLGANITATLNANDQIGLEVSGTTITVYQNGSSIGTRTDSDVAGSGYPGLNATWPTGSKPILDDFGGGAISAGGADAVPVAWQQYRSRRQ